MLISIVSPAKKLNFEKDSPVTKHTEIHYTQQVSYLAKKMKKQSVDQIQKMMKLSDSLAQLNFDRYQKLQFPLTTKNGKQAMYAFNGDTYVGLNAESFTTQDINYAQKSLRILSGLYGVLRPLDLIAPYRLEMGTRFPIDSQHSNLYSYWQEELTSYFKNLLGKKNTLINLASKEYFSAIDLKQLEGKVITPQFKQKKNGELKSIGMMSKRARGMMAAYIIQNRVEYLKDLLKFSSDGYKYSKQLSTPEAPVFIKNK